MSEIIIKINKKEFFEICEHCMNEVKFNSFQASCKDDLLKYMIDEITFYFNTCVANTICDDETTNDAITLNKIRVITD